MTTIEDFRIIADAGKLALDALEKEQWTIAAEAGREFARLCDKQVEKQASAPKETA